MLSYQPEQQITSFKKQIQKVLSNNGKYISENIFFFEYIFDLIKMSNINNFYFSCKS